MIDYSIYNKLYANDSLVNKILYIKQYSLFDILIEDIIGDKILQSTLNNQNHKYAIYNSVILNDIMTHYRYIESLTDCSHITFLVHEDLTRLKKEDSRIILNKIKQAKIINFNPINNSIFGQNLNYAVPKPNNPNNESKTKNILILGSHSTSKNPNVDNFIDFDSLKSYNDIMNLLQPYKLVVYNHHIESIMAKSIGCDTVRIDKFAQSIQECDRTETKINYDFSSFSAKLKKLLT